MTPPLYCRMCAVRQHGEAAGEFPKKGVGVSKLLKIIDELSASEPELGDWRSLGPMMSAPDPVALYAFIKFIRHNLNDPAWFKVSAKLLDETVSMLGSLLHFKGRAWGIPTYGGSESNLSALYAVRELGYDTLVTPRSAHASVFKACRVLRMRVVTVDVDSELRALPDSIAKAVRNVGDRAAILLTAGNTETGVIDRAREVYELVPDTPIVVDAAFGGLIAPFLEDEGTPLPQFDFRVPSVVAVGVDGHKAGLTPIPSGMVILKKELYEKLTFSGDYMGRQKQLTLLWTRTAASVASLWASIKRHGFNGFAEIYRECLKLTWRAYRELTGLGFSVNRPELPILCFKHECVDSADLYRFLRGRGWYVYRCPSLGGVKITLMPHVTQDIVSEFIDDVREFVKSAMRG